MERVVGQDFKVIDFHVHFPIAERGRGIPWGKRYRLEGWKIEILEKQAKWYNDKWRKTWGFPEPEKEEHSDEEQAQRWAGEVKRYNLEKVVFVTGGGNDRLAKVIKSHPDKFIGFAHHDLFSPGAAQELKRAITELGLQGYKVIAPTLEKPIYDRAAFPVWEVAEEYEIPLLIHFGPLGGGGGITWSENIDPLLLHDIAKYFPTVNFVIPHFGCGYLREVLHLCWACRNVYIDTSGSNQWRHWMPQDLTLEALFRKFIETIGPERLIFGSDSSWFPRGFSLPYLKEQLKACHSLGLNVADLEKIFYGNAARLLKIIG